MTTGLAIQGEDWSLAPVRPEFIARERCGAWIDPQGRIYPVIDGDHDKVAERLRAAGHGPDRGWDVSRPWLNLKAHGVVFGTRVTLSQWASLADISRAAGGNVAACICESLRATGRLVGHMPDRFASGYVPGVTRLIRAHEGD